MRPALAVSCCHESVARRVRLIEADHETAPPTTRVGPFPAFRWWTGQRGPIQLLKQILADQPRLPGAACVGRHHVSDPLPGNDGRVHREANVPALSALRRAARR